MNLVSKHAFEFSFLYFCYSKPIPMEHPMENVRKRKVTNWVKFMRGGHFLPSPPPRFFRPSDNCTMGSDPQKKRGGTFCPTWHIASFPNFVERRVTPFPVFSFSFFSSNFAVTWGFFEAKKVFGGCLIKLQPSLFWQHLVSGKQTKVAPTVFFPPPTFSASVYEQPTPSFSFILGEN